MKNPRFDKLFVGLSALILLSGCSTQSSSNGNSPDDTQNTRGTAEVVGTDGQLISIQSDNVRAAGYDADSLVMTVQFDNAAMYEYYGVPSGLWQAFVDAQPHSWSRVGYPRLVREGIPYKRMR